MEGVEVFFSEKLKSFRIMSVGDCPAGIRGMKERGSTRLHGNLGETVGQDQHAVTFQLSRCMGHLGGPPRAPFWAEGGLLLFDKKLR